MFVCGFYIKSHSSTSVVRSRCSGTVHNVGHLCFRNTKHRIFKSRVLQLCLTVNHLFNVFINH